MRTTLFLRKKLVIILIIMIIEGKLSIGLGGLESSDQYNIQSVTRIYVNFFLK